MKTANPDNHFASACLLARGSRFSSVALALIALLACSVEGQQFGGNGGGGRSSSRSSTSSSASSSYTPSGKVGDAYFSIDPESRRVVTIADEDTSKYISQVLSNLDRPKPQVLIKVVFLEVTHTSDLDLGVEGSFSRNIGNSTPTGSLMTNFSVIGSGSNASIVPSTITSAVKPLTMGGGTAFGSGLPNNTTSSGMYQLLGADYQVTLHAIAQAGNARVLSRPSILARNNQPATITVGQSVPLISGVRYDSLGNAINSINYRDIGVILRVTPFITPEGLVEMIISPEISSLDPTASVPISATTSGTVVNAPVIDVRSADTVAVTPDGQTVVIGGLMQNTKSSTVTKVPLLGDIPLLGNLFRRTQTADDKTELIIFLTPHVVQAPVELAAASMQEQKHFEGPQGLTEQELNKFLEGLPIKPKKPGKK